MLKRVDPPTEPVECISAITLTTADMARSVAFYEALGFEGCSGGASAPFTSLRAGPGFVNLQLVAKGPPPAGSWGRVILWVDDVDRMHRRCLAAGFTPLTSPEDAPWGERYFHIRDPNGHELSFARPLKANPDKPAPTSQPRQANPGRTRPMTTPAADHPDSLDDARGFVGTHHRAVMITRRASGALQTSPVAAAVDGEGRILVSTRSGSAKERNLTRDPRASLCVVSDSWWGPWVHLDGTAEVVRLPEAMDLLVAYYRHVSGEHPDWDDYRKAMTDEGRVMVRITLDHATAVASR